MMTSKQKTATVLAGIGFLIFAVSFVGLIAHFYQPKKKESVAELTIGDASQKSGMKDKFARIKFGMGEEEAQRIMGGGESLWGGGGLNLNDDGSWSTLLRYEGVGHVENVGIWTDENGQVYSIGFNNRKVAAKGWFFVDRTVNGRRTSDKRGGP